MPYGAPVAGDLGKHHCMNSTAPVLSNTRQHTISSLFRTENMNEIRWNTDVSFVTGKKKIAQPLKMFLRVEEKDKIFSHGMSTTVQREYQVVNGLELKQNIKPIKLNIDNL